MSQPLRLPHDRDLARIAACADARLLWVEALLDRLIGGPARVDEARRAIEAAEAAAAATDVDLPDAQLARRYQLGAVDRDLLWLIASPAIDPAMVLGIRRMEGGAGRDWFDPSLASRAVGASRGARLGVIAALEADAPLRRTGLVRAGAADRAFGRDLVPASWLPGFLRGVRAPGPRLDGVAAVVRPALSGGEVPLPERAFDLLPILAGFFAGDAEPPPAFGPGALGHPRGVAVLIHGHAGSGRMVLVRTLAGRLGRRLLVVDGARLRGLPIATGVEVIDAACAEAAALDELLVIRGASGLIAPEAPLAVPLARAIAAERVAALLIASDDAAMAVELEELVVVRHHHEVRPGTLDPAELWLTNLPPRAELDPGLDIDAFARTLQLTPVQVRAAARAAAIAAAGARPIAEADLDVAARGQLQHGIGKLVEIEDATVTLADLILPDDQRTQIEEIIAAVRNRDTVLRRWGLRRTVKRGLSVSCLFDGDPGTGKTLSAEVIASELGLQMLRINVASIVDKYIGETEKNLTRIFEQARPDTTLLLFDEADSLFSKRTEVQHATDRYSNMDVNVLLQLLERFEGTAVLTTNLKRSIDAAFERRIMFKIRFERPDAEQRTQIWKRLLPPSFPTAEAIDHGRLGRIELSGGEIRNAVVRAAYAAAKDGTRVTMKHLVDAAAHEASSTGRVYVDVR